MPEVDSSANYTEGNDISYRGEAQPQDPPSGNSVQDRKCILQDMIRIIAERGVQSKIYIFKNPSLFHKKQTTKYC